MRQPPEHALDALRDTVVAFRDTDPTEWPEDALRTAEQAFLTMLIAIRGELDARGADQSGVEIIHLRTGPDPRLN